VDFNATQSMSESNPRSSPFHGQPAVNDSGRRLW